VAQGRGKSRGLDTKRLMSEIKKDPAK